MRVLVSVFCLFTALAAPAADKAKERSPAGRKTDAAAPPEAPSAWSYVKDLQKSMQSASGSLEKSLDAEMAGDVPSDGKHPTTGKSVSDDPAVATETLQKLRHYIEALGVNVMKQVEDTVNRPQKMSDEVDPPPAKR